MSELSIFVDESGDFGPYQAHAPFYVVTLVFHNQASSIERQINLLEKHLVEMGMSERHCFHTGPIIRREEDYQYMSVKDRRKCLNQILTFTKNSDISYVNFSVEKKHLSDSMDLTIKLTKELSAFIKEHFGYFTGFDRIVLYYDNGQVELGRLLATVFSIYLPETEFKKVLPANYRIFQVADLICSMELIKLKKENKILSRSEEMFFGSMKDLKKNYLKPLSKKEFFE